mmetsp:Transcript_67457/g.179347  ORF Transcript_67457/g.179347 Transcript_67457/m.179347 type:complete len:217 (+) Transcript_67457:644-1294(+)
MGSRRPVPLRTGSGLRWFRHSQRRRRPPCMHQPRSRRLRLLELRLARRRLPRSLCMRLPRRRQSLLPCMPSPCRRVCRRPSRASHVPRSRPPGMHLTCSRRARSPGTRPWPSRPSRRLGKCRTCSPRKSRFMVSRSVLPCTLRRRSARLRTKGNRPAVWVSASQPLVLGFSEECCWSVRWRMFSTRTELAMECHILRVLVGNGSCTSRIHCRSSAG